MGSRIPEIDLKTFDPAELGKKDVSEITPKDVNTKEFFAKKTVAVFSITGAFTPVVSKDVVIGMNANYLFDLFMASVLQNNCPDSSIM